jgi:hypothetical protein
MTRDSREDERDDELAGEALEPTPPEGESFPPTAGETSDDDESAGEDDLAQDLAPEATGDIPATELGDEAGATPLDVAAPTSAADSAVEADSTAAAESESEGPKAATESDWSNWVPAPGYADPETGQPVFRWGKIDQAGCDLMLLAHGLRPLFEPESDETAADQAAPPPFLASPPQGGHATPPGLPMQHDSSPSPLVSVDVRVALTDGELTRISNGSIRRAAEYARAELMVVARKLQELCEEIRARETQRRILARQY